MISQEHVMRLTEWLAVQHVVVLQYRQTSLQTFVAQNQMW